MQQRPDEGTGDYEYDLAHEAVAGRQAIAHEAAERPGRAPARPAQADQDMTYDEAHDF